MAYLLQLVPRLQAAFCSTQSDYNLQKKKRKEKKSWQCHLVSLLGPEIWLPRQTLWQDICTLPTPQENPGALRVKAFHPQGHFPPGDILFSQRKRTWGHVPAISVLCEPTSYLCFVSFATTKILVRNVTASWEFFYHEKHNPTPRPDGSRNGIPVQATCPPACSCKHCVWLPPWTGVTYDVFTPSELQAFFDGYTVFIIKERKKLVNCKSSWLRDKKNQRKETDSRRVN